MLNLRKFFAGGLGRDAPARIPRGERVYAIGDVHGRFDLLCALARKIDEDDATAKETNSTVVFLGDLIDRGPESSSIIDFVMHWSQQRAVRILKGNHEEMFLDSYADLSVLNNFLRYGGRETLWSYGIATEQEPEFSLPAVQQAMHEHIPLEHREFIAAFENRIAIGGYLFVHAGIQPGISVDEQDERVFRWIREPFLSHEAPHSHMVVHGHTITSEAEERPNRIGIDTGAYCYGRLTAIVLEEASRRFLQAQDRNGVITVKHAVNAPELR